MEYKWLVPAWKIELKLFKIPSSRALQAILGYLENKSPKIACKALSR